MCADYPDQAPEDAKAIAARIRAVDGAAFKSPWNVHYASHLPERSFSDLLFHKENAHLFEAFAKMPNVGGYAFPYSYKPAKAAKTHVANESFNPDFFLRVKDREDILVVELKADGDDSNRNRAKWRDGVKHFQTLNERLKSKGEKWRYHFYFLSPENYTTFFERVRKGDYAGWRSKLMQELDGSAS
jgi:type III restriction enzyme